MYVVRLQGTLYRKESLQWLPLTHAVTAADSLLNLWRQMIARVAAILLILLRKNSFCKPLYAISNVWRCTVAPVLLSLNSSRGTNNACFTCINSGQSLIPCRLFRHLLNLYKRSRV